jgi:hypothetical protein
MDKCGGIMSNVLKQFAKFITAGIVAFILLNLFCLVYYYVPGHVAGKTGATDYVYPQYARYSQMAEGFGYGRINNEGYNNTDDYNAQKIDVLLMGSSHIEGMNVGQNEMTASLLNKFLKSKYTYNIGFSSHGFLRNLGNLENAVDCYKPKGYVVLEIQNTVSDMQDLEDVVNSNLERLPSFDHGLLSSLQRIPYLRLGYRQIKFLTGFHVVDMLKMFRGGGSEIEEQSDSIDWDRMGILLDALMADTRRICADNGIDFMMVYHPHLTVEKDGSAAAEQPNEYLTRIRNACNSNGIHFMDMTNAFIAEYDATHLLPHGFSNTAVGTGHLNKTGHRLIASQLSEFINKIEGKESI